MAAQERAAAPAARIDLHGKVFVAGLVWQPPATKLRRAAMHRRGKATGFGLAVRHAVGQSVQVGYAPKDAAEPGVYSLAAVLAKAVSKDNWIGAFPLPDARYVLVGVRQGAIMAGHDCVGTRDQIESLLRETVQLMEDLGESWDAIYAPGEFETPWPQAALIQLLPKSAVRSVGRLESLTGEMSRQQKTAFAVAAVAIVVVAVGAWAWKTYRHAAPARPAATAQPIVKVPPPHPWRSQPQPATQLAIWRQALSRIPLALAGWHAEEIELDAHSATVSYRRNGGVPVHAFQQAAIAALGHGPEVAEAGTHAKIALTLPTPGGVDDVLQPKDEALIAITSYFQSLGMEVPVFSAGKTSTPPPPAPPAAGMPRRIWDAADWQTYQWSLNTEIPPSAVFSNEAIPGLRINNLKVIFSGSTPRWVLNGVFYAKD
jgi:hypothetical protein